MNHPDVEYLNLVKRIFKEGVVKEDRTGTGTISLFGPQMEFDLSEGFPLLTTKRVPFRLIVSELLWFINGDTDLKTLLDKNVHIWDGDAYRFYKESGGTLEYEEFLKYAQENGFDLGPIYGSQWRSWQVADTYYEEGLDTVLLTDVVVDQLQDVIDGLVIDPDSRRHIISAWNPGAMPDMALPPCHIMLQLYVENGTLSGKMYQRSGDMFLGVPFNIASYALLIHLIAKITGLKVGKLIHTLGDAHIYLNHVEQLQTQLHREPKKLPTLHIKTNHEYIEDYTEDDIELTGYDPHGPLKGKVSVGL
jgi:thymidylate synthase